MLFSVIIIEQHAITNDHQCLSSSASYWSVFFFRARFIALASAHLAPSPIHVYTVTELSSSERNTENVDSVDQRSLSLSSQHLSVYVLSYLFILILSFFIHHDTHTHNE